MSTETPATDPSNGESFAETALKLGGKSAEEARRTGVIDSADDNVESLFKPEYQTVNSPAHRAVWDTAVPMDLFESRPATTPPDVEKVMDDSVSVVQRHRASGSLLDENQKLTDHVLGELADVGYWGLLVDKEYGGAGRVVSEFRAVLDSHGDG